MLEAPMIYSAIPEPCPVMTVNEAVACYIKLRVEQGMDVNSDTYRHIRKQLRDHLCGSFGSWPLADVRVEHLREWVRTLTSKRAGAAMCLLTRRHYATAVKVFFKRCVLEGWVARDPSRALILPTPAEQDVNVIKARDAWEFFRKNRHHRAIGRLALEAFGGLRYTSAGKIRREEINMDSQGLELLGNKHKSKKRKYRQGQPQNCWDWVKSAQDSCWTLTLRQYRDEKKEMLCMSGLRPMVMKTEYDRDKVRALKNVWRHSFATYMIARVKNFGPVAYLMQHSSLATTELYEGRGDELEAALYFGITPHTVCMEWGEYHALIKRGYDASMIAAAAAGAQVKQAQLEIDA